MNFYYYLALFVFLLICSSIKIVQQYEKGVIFRLGRVVGEREPGMRWVWPIVDRLRKVTTQIMTMPVPSQKIITRDNVDGEGAAAIYKSSC